MTRVAVLGSVTSRTEESQWQTLAPNARQLLAILVAAGPDGLSFERVADELWPGDLPATWDASLRMAFARLRKQLPADSLTNKARWCRLDLAAPDVDAWGLAEQADAGASTAFDTDGLIARLALEAFPLVEVSPIIRDAIDRFDLLRVLLLDRLIEQGASISPLAAVQLRSFAASRDWDAALAERVERLIDNPTKADTVALDFSIATQVPLSLARRRAQALVGREASVEQLIALATNEQQPIAVLTAPAKSGRSATLAEVGTRLAAIGWRIIHLEPTLPAAAFGPFLQALPQLRDSILAALASDASDAQVRSRCWASILQALEHPDLSTCVIVDDAHLLDSNSEEALAFIGRCRTANPLSIIIGGDLATASSAWDGAPRIELPPISLDAVREMVAAMHPGTSELHQLQISNEISTLAEGRAARAAQLARAASPEAGSSSLSDENGARSDAALSGVVLDIAAAASIIRSPISLESLEHVSQLESHRVLTIIDELLGMGILAETSRPDVFELIPSHERGDFISAIDPGERAQLSLRAMTLPGRTPVAAAHDAVRAHDLLGDGKVIEALLAAAASLVASHGHREAVAYLKSAEELGAELSAETLVSYATSLELMGIDAVAVRDRAIAEALSNEEHSIALDAALAGLPSAERIDGDPARTHQIESVDPDQLARADRLRRHLALSRQLMLVSRPDDARTEVSAAHELTETIEEEADVWLAMVHIERWQPTGNRQKGFEVSRFHSVDAVVDPTRRARLLQASAVSALIAGDFATAAAEVAELTVAADASEDPLRIWHASLLRSALQTNDLRLDEAERTADEARNLGVQFGVRGAVAGRLAQRSNRAALLGEGVNQLGRLEVGRTEETRSLLARAAACAQLARTGRATEAGKLAEELVAASVNSRFEIAVAGLLSGAVRTAPTAVREHIAARLEPLRGTLLVIGAGLTIQGPVDSLLANIAESEVSLFELRHHAVEFADSLQSPLWQVATRVDLGREYGRAGRTAEQRAVLSEAAERAAGTDFAVHERWGLFDS